MIVAKMPSQIKSKREKLILRFSLFLLISGIYFPSAKAQIKEAGVRPVTITTEDSLIKAFVWDKPIKRHVKVKYPYYWYGNNSIHKNVGNFSGKLLHGKYEVFDSKNNLVSKGNFDKGLKQGVWTYWHSGGSMKSLFTYKNGILEGPFKLYDGLGKLREEGAFNEDNLNGKVTFYQADTMLVKKYFKGKEIIISKRKPCFFSSTKKEKTKVTDNDKKGKSTHKAFWKKVFPLKKKQPANQKENIKAEDNLKSSTNG